MISIIVPVKNGLALTRALLESARASNPVERIDWVIVDSGSTDGTADFCRDAGARRVEITREPFNYCAALNAGAAHAHGDVWIFCNNDIEFRSTGDLARLEMLFQEWPVVGLVSPWESEARAPIQFRDDWLYGPCWAVRPELFRAWGGMPETLSGYGYDEVWTLFQCWRLGRAVALLPGWKLFHHGSATFGPTGATATPAMRRNLLRLLEICGAQHLDRPIPMQQIVDELINSERGRVSPLLSVPDAWSGEAVRRQGMPGVVRRSAGDAAAARVEGDAARLDERQWLPWLANELLLQPGAASVGGDGFAAVRCGSPAQAAAAVAVGPPAPPLVAPPVQRPASLRERVVAWIHDLRQRGRTLPPEW